MNMGALHIRELLPAKTAKSLSPGTAAIWTTIYSYIRLCYLADPADKYFVRYLQYKHPKISMAAISRHLRRMADAGLIAPFLSRECPPAITTRYALPKKTAKVPF